ncbi:MAG: chorismate synthase [Polyangiales bacterium]
MRHFRFLTAGESHGPALVGIIDGVPAGLALGSSDIDPDLARRQRGYGRGGRMKIETDKVNIQSGVRGGETLGGPIALVIANKDFENWRGRMGAQPFDAPPEAVVRPRPGHADLAGGLKYDRHDLRDILERASARETARRVAVGAVARTLLARVGIEIFAHVVSIGNVDAHAHTARGKGETSDTGKPGNAGYALDSGTLRMRARASDLSCADPDAEEAMREAILEASHAGDTLGGTFEMVALGVPPGLGSHVQWDRKLDGRIAQALMCIQAIKGVEIGFGFAAARLRGSQVHDPIAYDAGTSRFVRASNGAGGIEGGITNGAPVVVRAAMKPIATLRKPLPSVHVDTKIASEAAFERSDICAVAAASVVGEAMLAIALADALLEKFGGDSLGELLRNVEGYRAQIGRY